MNPVYVNKQKECIDKAHSMGAEVLMSAHVRTHLDCEQTVSLAVEIQSRGVDIVKIVTTCPSVEHILEMLRTTIELKKRIRVPFLYICQGPYACLSRYLGPLFGSMLAFGHHDYTEMSNVNKQLLW